MSENRADEFMDKMVKASGAMFPDGQYPPFLKAEFDQSMAACREAGFDEHQSVAIAIMSGVETFSRRFGQPFVDRGISHHEYAQMMVNIVSALTLTALR